jgi:hypothetical protein
MAVFFLRGRVRADPERKTLQGKGGKQAQSLMRFTWYHSFIILLLMLFDHQAEPEASQLLIRSTLYVFS